MCVHLEYKKYVSICIIINKKTNIKLAFIKLDFLKVLSMHLYPSSTQIVTFKDILHILNLYKINIFLCIFIKLIIKSHFNLYYICIW